MSIVILKERRRGRCVSASVTSRHAFPGEPGNIGIAVIAIATFVLSKTFEAATRSAFKPQPAQPLPGGPRSDC